MSLFDGIIGCWDAGGKRSYPGTGTTWYDVVGGNNATLTNNGGDGPNFNSAKGGCISFDGTNDYASIGEIYALTDPTSATASVWFRVEGHTGNYGGILAAQFRWGFIYINDGAGSWLDESVVSYSWGDDSQSMEPTTTLSAGWHQAVTTWTPSGGSNSASLYIDGVLAAQGQIIYNMGDDAPLEIGRSAHNIASQWFEGDITAIYIYDRVLTPAQIKQLYYMQKSRFED